MTYDEFLMQALVSQGVLEEFLFIREATPVIVGGSEQIFEAVKELSDKQGGIWRLSFNDLAATCLVRASKQSSCGATAATVSSRRSTAQRSRRLRTSPRGRPTVRGSVQDACQHGLVVYDAHREWHREHGQRSLTNQLSSCSCGAPTGMSFGLEQGYHELPGVKKGIVYHEPPHDGGVNDAAEQGAKVLPRQGRAPRLRTGVPLPKDSRGGRPHPVAGPDWAWCSSRRRHKGRQCHGPTLVPESSGRRARPGTTRSVGLSLQWRGLSGGSREGVLLVPEGGGPERRRSGLQPRRVPHTARCRGRPGQGSRISERSREPGARRGRRYTSSPWHTGHSALDDAAVGVGIREARLQQFSASPIASRSSVGP